MFPGHLTKQPNFMNRVSANYKDGKMQMRYTSFGLEGGEAFRRNLHDSADADVLKRNQ